MKKEERRALPFYLYVSHTSAMTSTSQRTFLGKVFTATQLLAGFW